MGIFYHIHNSLSWKEKKMNIGFGDGGYIQKMHPSVSVLIRNNAHLKPCSRAVNADKLKSTNVVELCGGY